MDVTNNTSKPAIFFPNLETMIFDADNKYYIPDLATSQIKIDMTKNINPFSLH